MFVLVLQLALMIVHKNEVAYVVRSKHRYVELSARSNRAGAVEIVWDSIE